MPDLFGLMQLHGAQLAGGIVGILAVITTAYPIADHTGFTSLTSKASQCAIQSFDIYYQAVAC